MKQQTIERDNGIPFVFDGEHVAHASTSDGRKRRWTEIDVWVTDKGMHIVRISGCSSVEGEVTRRKAYLCKDNKELLDKVGTGWLSSKIYEQLGLHPTFKV